MQTMTIKNKKDNETYTKDFNSVDEAKNWVINHLDLSKDWKINQTKKMTKKQKEKQEAIEYLKEHIKKGDTLYTKIVKVSPSGMSRQITVLDIKDQTPSYWSYYVSKVLDYKLKDNGALFVKGCGMDMGFHVVYSLSKVLFNDGYAIKQRWI